MNTTKLWFCIVCVFDNVLLYKGDNKHNFMNVERKELSRVKTNEQYFRITENIAYGAIWIDEKGVILEYNDLFYQDLGYGESADLPKTIFEVNPFLSLVSWRESWKELCDVGEIELETQHINAKGIIHPVQFKGLLINTEDGEMCLAIVNSKRKGRHRQHLELISSITQVGSWQHDLIKSRWFFTDEIFHLLQIKRSKKEESLADILRPLMQPNDYAFLVKKLEKTEKGGDTFSMEFGIPNPTEETSKHLRLTAVPEKGEEETFSVYGTLQEISDTGERSVEMNLANSNANVSSQQKHTQSQELTEFTLEHNPLMVLWIKKSGEIIYANQSACKQLEYEKSELIKQNINAISDSYPDIRMWNARWRIMKEEEGKPYEGTIKNQSGRIIPVEITRHYIQNEGEEFICEFLSDITERKIRESQIQVDLNKSLTESAQLSKELKVLRSKMKPQGGLNSIVTNSNRYMKVLTEVRRVAETDATVLITGETGTGKELLAKAVHELSERSDENFIKVNAAVIPENLFESELFGHEKGSFTGAHQARTGRFEAADKGTIFLDEIGEMAIGLQAKLLRVLQEGEFERVGGSKTIKVDVRVVAATNRNLEQMVAEGKFREDLFYRLNVFPIHNLPLRERIEDIPFLVKFFLKKYARKIGKEVKEVSDGDLQKLMKYNFPGNVRELENMVERAIILTSGTRLNLADVLKLEKKKSRKKVVDTLTMDEMQRVYIIETIKKCGGRVSGKNGAAFLLGMKDKTLYSRIKKLEIQKSEYVV